MAGPTLEPLTASSLCCCFHYSTLSVAVSGTWGIACILFLSTLNLALPRYPLYYLVLDTASVAMCLLAFS